MLAVLVFKFQLWHYIQDLDVTRWNEQCTFNLMNNLTFPFPSAE